MAERELELGDKVEVKQFPILGADTGYVVKILPKVPYPYYLHSKPETDVTNPDMGPYSRNQLELIG